jgi:NarL family two-component system response regulator LiaR
MNSIKVLVADDHAVLREGICALLAHYEGVTVVGQASNGAQTIEQVGSLQPDIVLMDVSMPGMDGLEATREIKTRWPKTRVVVLTQHENEEYVFPLLKAGASGYVLKKAGGDELVEAIRVVSNGGTFLDPSIAQQVVEHAVQTSPDSSPSPRLTERECEVLRLIAEGMSTREIADTLQVSANTVITHRSNIMEKLDVHNRAELVKYAIRKKLIQI